MNRIVLALLLCPFTMAAQSTLNDLDGDGCVGATDVLIVLGQYGECQDTTTVACGDSVLFDNYWYETVLIGDQCWFAENLRTTVYRDGTAIPSGLTDEEWATTTSGATSVYGEGSSFCDHDSPDIDACDEAQSLAEYGRLYNGIAVSIGYDSLLLCPSGWHVPYDSEWTELEDYINGIVGNNTAGYWLKSTTGWYAGGNGSDDFGFSAPPGGERHSEGHMGDAGRSGYWWSGTFGSTPSGGYGYYRNLHFSLYTITRSSISMRTGMSVRCLRDAE